MCIYFPPPPTVCMKSPQLISTIQQNSANPFRQYYVVIFRIITLRLNQQKQIKPEKEIKAYSV